MSSRVERVTFSRSGSGGVPASSPCEQRVKANLSAAERDRYFEFILTLLKSIITATRWGVRDGEDGRKR